MDIQKAARESRHTRGPWNYDSVHWALNYSDTAPGGWVNGGMCDDETGEEIGATAKVATAAPEMFDALARLLETDLTDEQRSIVVDGLRVAVS